MKILITGANGYIGRNLVKSALQKGFEVNALVRNKSDLAPEKGVNFFQYDLSLVPDAAPFENVETIIHLATCNDAKNLSHKEIIDLELKALQNLLAQALVKKVKNFIFISSQSAAKNSPTNYGYRKWLLEEEVLKNNGVVIRPGLVYGEEERALFGTLCHLAKNLPLLPEFLPKLYVQPVHLEDLSAAILTLAVQNSGKSIHNIAQKNPISITEFLRQLAWYKYERQLFFIPLPQFVLKLVSFVNRERINGLLALQPMEVSENFNLRNLPEGLKNKNSSNLYREGEALISYVAGKNPQEKFVRKYVEVLQNAAPLGLNKIYLNHHLLLRLVDPRSAIFSVPQDLDQRLKFALIIAESDPENIAQFVPFKKMGLVRAIFMLIWNVCLEIFFKILGRLTKFFRKA